ncbi:peptide deformylase [Geitlerinema calcuttense]|uniref:Peptide deformylase n=1 Tax=Geitlerinema calcuttense NRMC-F 0142 TaxID=2922238 RepID=A0ABT7LZJ7_9CYAN|nr:peptide deformylase [Geitlerinema calcuttense]MDL5057224.1 peptide deformylase [Geitlerinema calcuttense NRMC-F 0142]
MSDLPALCLLDHPILRQVARPVEVVGDRSLQTTIEQLTLTMQAANGVGIAAPQIGLSYQLLIVASRPNPRYPHAPEMSPTPMINPRLIATSSEVEKGWEGCLSIPKIRGLVPRYSEVEVEYTTPTGQIQQQILTGFVARIFQHEFDHLNGLLFIDRVENSQELLSEQDYQLLLQSQS